MAKKKLGSPKVSDARVKQIFKGHKNADRNNTYKSSDIVVVKKGKTPKKSK